jgi:hypothetical protein
MLTLVPSTLKSKPVMFAAKNLTLEGGQTFCWCSGWRESRRARLL